MERKRLETKVGLFVFIGLMLLAVLLIQFSKGTSLFHSTYTLRLHAVTAGNLKPRAGVSLAGVPIGSISDIKLDSDSKAVTIFLKIYQDNKIYHDARFSIQQSGFIGDQFVAVEMTDNQLPYLQNGADVNCESPFNLQETVRSATGFILRIDETAKKLDASISELQRDVLNERTLTNVAAAVENLRSFSEQAINTVGDFNSLIATNGSQVGVAVSNLVYVSQDLKRILDDVHSGKGAAGMVLENQQFATNVQAIANNLEVATSNLNRLGLWRFLWHREPESTNSADLRKAH